ncbi:MAG: TonB-dependent receptor plug domain-containing protein [Opitutaceae bacterium]
MNAVENLIPSTNGASPWSRTLVRLVVPLAASLAVHELSAQSNVSTEVGGTTAEEKGVVVLTPFQVSGSSDVGYGATASGASGRLNEKYIDIPQMISVVTSEFMKDLNLFDTGSAVSFIPNVQSERSSDFQVFKIRGLSSTALYTDGFKSNDRMNVDMAFADRLEVVKGPSSVSFGRGNPAGFINLVTKKPTFDESTATRLTAGFGGVGENLRFMVDRNGTFGKKRQLGYRVVAQVAENSGTRDNTEVKRNGVLLALSQRIRNRGEVSLTSYYFQNYNSGSVGNLSFNDATIQRAFRPTSAQVPLLPMDYVFSYKNQGYRSDMYGTNMVFTYKLNDSLSVRQAATYTHTVYHGTQTTGNIGSVQQGADGKYTVNLPNTKNYFDYAGWSYQADIIFKRKLDFLSSSYTVMLGGDYTQSTYLSGEGQNASNFVTRQPYLDFNPDSVPTDFYFARGAGTYGTLTDGTDYSPYLHAAASGWEGKVRASYSARYLWVDQTSTNLVTGGVTVTKSRSPLLPAATLLFKPLPSLTVFGMASKYQVLPTVRGAWGLDNATGLDPSDPRFGETVVVQAKTEMKELGFKAELLKGKLFVSAAVFKVANGGVLRFRLLQDSRYPGRTLTNIFVTTDDVKGWEVEMFGQPTKRLTMMAGAGFIDSASAVVSGADTVMLKYPGNPNTVYGNLKYSFGPKPSQGLIVTAGVKTYLSGWSANFNSVVALGDLPYPDSLTVVNFGASYGFPKASTRLGLSVNNAFHKDSKVKGSFLAVEQGRIIYLSLDNRF